MFDALFSVMQTPYFWQSLGMVSATSLFISPILYNGDYKAATKTVICIGLYGFYIALLSFFHLLEEGKNMTSWMQPIDIVVFVTVAYVFGLYLGIFLQRKILRK